MWPLFTWFIDFFRLNVLRIYELTVCNGYLSVRLPLRWECEYPIVGLSDSWYFLEACEIDNIELICLRA